MGSVVEVGKRWRFARSAQRCTMSEAAVPGVPMEQLLRELPLEDAGLVPLVVLVERLSNSAYQTLQSLAETLPAMPSDARRAKLFATAIELRKLFIKLLVIVRWSSSVDQLNRARNVVALLVEQQWAHEDVFSGLTQVRKILPNARMCEADLMTAIDVFRSGTFPRLPTAIRDSTVPTQPLSDDDARNILSGLDDVLRTRLTCSEVVPMGLRLDRIADGKAYFIAPNLYDMSLTSSGPAVEDRWWLLDFHFADRVDEEQAPTLTTPYIEHIYSTAEEILAAPHTQVLSQVHELFEQESLQRKLHILNHPAHRMVRFNWGSNVRFALDIEARALEVRYWALNGDIPSESHGSALHRGLLQGAIRLSLRTQLLIGSQRVLANLIHGCASKASNKSSIHVEWLVDAAIPAAQPAAARVCVLEELDIEAVLLSTIQKHSHALMTLFQSEILHHDGLSAGDTRLCRLRSHATNGYGPRHSLELRVSDTMRVMLYVSTISGRVGLKLLDAVKDDRLVLSLSESQNAALQRMAEQVHAKPESLGETLYSYRLKILARSLELQASWVGLPTASAVLLRPGEMAKLDLPHASPLLFLPLENFPAYHLLVYFVPGQQLHMALVSMMPIVEGGRSLHVISSVKWFTQTNLSQYTVSGGTLMHASAGTAGDAAESPTRYGIPSEQLELAYLYCIATVTYTHLEEQLRLKLVPFLLVGVTTNTPAPPSGQPDPLLPSLCVSSEELLAPFTELVAPNVSLQLCHWWHPDKRCVVLTTQVDVRSNKFGETRLFDHARLHLHSGLLCVTSRQMSSSVAGFQQQWTQIARMCSLIKLALMWPADAPFRVALEAVELQQVTLAYWFINHPQKKWSVKIKFFLPEDNTSSNRYELVFVSEHDANPHKNIARLLERKLNDAAAESTSLWYNFFFVCLVSSLLTFTDPTIHTSGASFYGAILPTSTGAG